MITNRTQKDITDAIDIRDKKVKTFQELTEDDIEILEKGFLTITSLNRIEDKQAELKRLLNLMGYWDTNIKNVNWTYDNILNVTELERIISNIHCLRKAFYTQKNTPDTPNASYYYEDINSIEKILQDIELAILNVKKQYRYSGTFACGEE